MLLFESGRILLLKYTFVGNWTLASLFPTWEMTWHSKTFLPGINVYLVLPAWSSAQVKLKRVLSCTSLGRGWRSSIDAAAAAAHPIQNHPMQCKREKYTTLQHKETAAAAICKWGRKDAKLGMPPFLGNLPDSCQTLQGLSSCSPAVAPSNAHDFATSLNCARPDTDSVLNPTQPISKYSNIPGSLTVSAIHTWYHIHVRLIPIQVPTQLLHS